MKSIFELTGLCLLSCAMLVTAAAAADSASAAPGSLNDPEDPVNLLPNIQLRGTQKTSLFPASPLSWLHDSTTRAKADFYDATSIKLGATFTHLFQGLSDNLPGEDNWGTATTSDYLATWELADKGSSTQGELVFHAQARWNYGTTGPETLAAASLGSLLGTANTFERYDPTFILRNLFWRQGSAQAGWSYRVGKITPDALLATSSHVAAATTVLPTAGVGPFHIALPDSGLGAVGAWYVNDRVTLVGLVSDANGDRYNSGDIGEGDLFTAVELHAKIAPRTPKAGYSKLTLWHTDGTKDGLPANGQTGPSGWGFSVKHEQELTSDGRAVGILRYGKGFDNSAFYDRVAAAYFMLYDPGDPVDVRNDLIGVAFKWADASQGGTRHEYNAEIFYRFPIFPHVDMTLHYQYMIDPALDLGVDDASVFSLRLRTTF
jgi:hypothetical protein